MLQPLELLHYVITPIAPNILTNSALLPSSLILFTRLRISLATLFCGGGPEYLHAGWARHLSARKCNHCLRVPPSLVPFSVVVTKINKSGFLAKWCCSVAGIRLSHVSRPAKLKSVTFARMGQPLWMRGNTSWRVCREVRIRACGQRRVDSGGTI
ncbi:hypothetical protein M433DRAFT_501741 [Acidomyces richmondensis BFW]|nr:hypothetical protein M433DRAFT_501741 [Acidomyces richmondensis BFW]